MSFLALLTFTIAALLAGLVVGALLNRKAFEARREAALGELFGSVETLPTYFRNEDIIELPEPVQRYLERNLQEDAPHHACMRVLERGSLRQQFGQPWTEFEGEGYLTASPAALVWFARLRPLPLVWVDELCVLIGGRARLGAKLLSSVTTVDASDERARQRALYRYIAHLPLLPDALLPADDRGWAGVPLVDQTDEDGDPLMRDDAARFWLRLGELEVSGVFEFDEHGDVVGFWTEGRPLDEGVEHGARWVVSYEEHRSFGSGEDLFLPTKLGFGWQTGDDRIAVLDKTIGEWRVDLPRSWSQDPG